MGAYDGNRDDGRAGMAREDEAPPFEGRDFRSPGPHPLGEYDKGNPRSDSFPSFLKRPDSAARMVPVHADVTALPQMPSQQRPPKEGGLRYEADAEGKAGQQCPDVKHAQMIGGEDVGLSLVKRLQTSDVHPDTRHP